MREGANGDLSPRERRRAATLAWRLLPTRRYFSAELTWVNRVLRAVPTPLTAVMITRLTPAVIRQYSIAVAPESSSRNLEISRPIQNPVDVLATRPWQEI